MSSAWKSQHLRVFALSLGLVVASLLAVLFGVRLEAVSHATGTLQAGDVVEVRAPFPGLVELGWYEGDTLVAGHALRARLDRHGSGITDPAIEPSRKIEHFRFVTPISQNTQLASDQLTFHKLQPGDLLWPDQPLAQMQNDDLARDLQRFKARLEDLSEAKEPAREAQSRYQALRDLLARSPVLAPTHSGWLVLKAPATNGQSLQPGDTLATLAPVDAGTQQPRAWVAHLQIPEKHLAGIEPGQEVRLYSTIYNQRLHGHAEGILERLDPFVEAGASERHQPAKVKITHSPFPLIHGASIKAEIVLGHKRVYRIILEQ